MEINDKYNQLIWTKTNSIKFTVYDNGIKVTEGSHDKITDSNVVLVANISGVNEEDIKYIAEPTLEAAKRKSSNNTMKIGAQFNLKLDKVGQTSAMTQRRFSSILNSTLSRFISQSNESGLFNKNDENMKDFKTQENWGFDTLHIPEKPKPTWEQVIKKKRGRGGLVETILYKPVFDANLSNQFEKDLRARPTPWDVEVANKELNIYAKPSPVAHRAAAALLRDRFYNSDITKSDNFVVKYKITSPDKTIQNLPSIFEIPTSDDYAQVDDPAIWNANYPLYPRQKRALGRMENIESEIVKFVEEERREFPLPGVGWLLEGKAELTTTVRGGVLGDVMGGGKTATTIALIAKGKTNNKARDLAQNASNATLILVPDNILGSWKTEINKFTGNNLKTLYIDDFSSLMRNTKKDIVEADIVVASMEILCKKKYLANLKKISKCKDLPDKTPQYLGQRAPESLVGTWVPGHPAEPYAGTKGNQKFRNISAYFTEHYKDAVEELREMELSNTLKGVPLEYFQWERLVFDECHEATCPGVGEIDEEDKKVTTHRGPLAAREIMGVATMDLKKRPLYCRKGTWGLTGTPMLSTVERCTELASMCGGTYVCGATKHWRNMERASGRDLFLEDLDSAYFASGAYRSRRFDHAQRYIKTSVQRNRTTEYTGSKSLNVIPVQMTAATYAEMKKLKKQLDKDPKNPATLSLMLAETNRIVWKNMLKTISQDENRGKELVKLIQKINQADKKTKIVIFAPYDCGAYDIALKALQSHCVEGFDVNDDKKIHFEYIDDTKPAETRREIIRLYSSIDISDGDRFNPRVLLLPFSHAAGHNFQYVGKDVILYAPLWKASDPVEAIAREQQAIGRVFRSGQVNSVNVYRFLLTHEKDKTFDIDDMIFRQNTKKENIEAACSE